MKRVNKQSLQMKIGVLIIGLISVVLAVFATLVIQENTNTMKQQIMARGMSLNSALSGVATNNVLKNDFSTLRDGIIAVKNSNKDIKALYLVDKTGKIYMDSNESKIGQTLKDKFTQQSNQDTKPMYHFYQDESGEWIYDIALPVNVDLERWGTLRVSLSTANMFAKINAARNIAIGSALALILISALISVFLVKRITGPIKDLARKMEILAQGDFTQEISIQSDDEIGILAKSVNNMIHHIRSLIKEVVTGSQKVVGTSKELTENTNKMSEVNTNIISAIENVAKGNNEQARQINESVNIINQLSIAINQIATGAQEQATTTNKSSMALDAMAQAINELVTSADNVAAVAKQTYQVAQQGGATVNDSINGMNNVQAKVYETAERIKELQQNSDKIGEIVLVIDEIAEQTNLLALNAAIEAARAGEYGKGFAVVADEVRKLAERSSKSTKEITTLIATIQDGTKRAVSAMEEGIIEVQKGAELSNNTGTALEDIVKNVGSVNHEVESILSATKQLSLRSDEMLEAMSNMAAITEENTASVEEISASTEHANQSMHIIAEISEQSSNTAEEVAASSQVVLETTKEMNVSVADLDELVENLNLHISRFKV